jgi:hypothetical protein
MKRIIGIAAVAAALAAPAMAQTAAQADALIAAIAAAGCEVREDNNAAILAAAGLTQDQASAVVAVLLGDGRAAVEGGSLRLKTAGCN